MGSRKVIAVTYGSLSHTDFILLESYQSWLKTIPESERGCVLITETNLTEDDLVFLERTKELINRHEHAVNELKLNLSDRLKMKSRKVS